MISGQPHSYRSIDIPQASARSSAASMLGKVLLLTLCRSTSCSFSGGSPAEYYSSSCFRFDFSALSANSWREGRVDPREGLIPPLVSRSLSILIIPFPPQIIMLISPSSSSSQQLQPGFNQYCAKAMDDAQ